MPCYNRREILLHFAQKFFLSKGVITFSNPYSDREFKAVVYDTAWQEVLLSKNSPRIHLAEIASGINIPGVKQTEGVFMHRFIKP